MAKSKSGETKTDASLFRYDEWALAKKIGCRPRFVVRWRREFGVEGVDFERVRSLEGGLQERIGLTEEGAKKAVAAFGLRLQDFSGCELRARGVQAEVKKMPSNTRLLICERVANKQVGAMDTVFVRNNGEFRVGDEFVAEWEDGKLVKRGGGLLPGEW